MKSRDCFQKKYCGFNLVETLIVLAISGMILGYALSAYTHFIAQKQLKTVAEELYNYLKLAQAESFKEHKTLYVSLDSPKTSNHWCYGLDDRRPCHCNIKNQCQLNNKEMVIKNTNHPNISLHAKGFSGPTNKAYIEFNGKRGTIMTTGSLHLKQGNLAITINTNSIGLVTLCSNQVSGFQLCQHT